MKKIVLCLTIASLMFGSMNISSALGNSLSDLQNRQNNLSSQKKDAQSELEDIKGQQKSVQEELNDLDVEFTAANDALNETELKLDETNARLEEAQKNLSEAQNKKDAQMESFSNRISFIYENGSIGYLQIIFEAKSFNDMLRRMQYVKDIMSYDETLLEELRETEATIKKQTENIEKEKQGIQTLADKQWEETQKLSKLVSQKKQTIEQFNSDAKKKEQYIAALEASSNEVARLIIAATANDNSGYVYTGGQLNWPIPSKPAASSSISSGYGTRTSPVGRGTEFHTGYDIPASYGADIVAAEAGTVITAGWVNGYGYTVIINHGGGLTTLYGHNSKLVVAVGDKVTRGQVIAKCGSTGWSTGNHCHFEVRVNGKHTNPGPYLGVKNVAY
ncbi:MAG: peptidoglycan DD-metalloendopeptidase family protein [Lachnospiraceae bacterium]|nr:peptidoglycan DD-metalloendopeptidase family protein [Lachnospiraceae bacterium]